MNIKDETYYKLEKHLKIMCEDSEEYGNLYASLQIIRQSVTKALKNVIINYPHYSEHDAGHSEQIISNIEMLLGRDNIERLSPTDTWMLIVAAYLHDIGMIIMNQDIEKCWKSEEFYDYLNELRNGRDEDLREGASYILRIHDKINNGVSDRCIPEAEHTQEMPDWPVRIKRIVTNIISAYYRGSHADNSAEYIRNGCKQLEIDISFNGMIPERLIHTLADVAYLHNEDAKKIMEYDYISNGYNKDYMHPRFVAQMIRLGDLLDADNNRFNVYTKLVAGEYTSGSMAHVNKHAGVRHLLITPTKIEYRADCADVESYRETRKLLTWIKAELEHLALHYKEIMPENVVGNAPRLTKEELLLNGVPDKEELADIRFCITQEKAFDIIEGSNLYEDKLICIREIIQNSMDACKLQMYADIIGGRCDAWIHGIYASGSGAAGEVKNDYIGLQPYDIDDGLYNNYEIRVDINTDDDDTLEICITDKGCGITVDTLKRMCKVGDSYRSDERKVSMIKSMPAWLRPTAGFGIGLQSVFLVNDSFDVYTKTPQDGGMKITFESRKKEGYVQASASDEMKTFGTRVCIKVSKDIVFKYNTSGATGDYIRNTYDPFEGENAVLAYKVLDVILDNCSHGMYPIVIYMDGALQSRIERGRIELNEDEMMEKDGFLCSVCHDENEDTVCVEMWDKSKYIYYRMRTTNINVAYRRNKIYFKGIEMENGLRFGSEYLMYDIDCYGYEAREYLTLDRKSFNKSVSEKVFEDLKKAYKVFGHVYEQYMIKMGEAGRRKYDYAIYIYWCMQNVANRDRLMRSGDLYTYTKITIPCFVIENGNIRKTAIKYTELYNNMNEVAYIEELDHMLRGRIDMNEKAALNMIKKVLQNNLKKLQCKYIILDDNFKDVLREHGYGRMLLADYYMPDNNKNKENYECHIIQIKKGNKYIETADEHTRESVFRTLLGLDNSEYAGAKRAYIPALAEYKNLAVDRLCGGMTGYSLRCHGFIISPMVEGDITIMKSVEKEQFVREIMERKSFERIVEYVIENSMEEVRPDKSVVAGEYEKLIEECYEMNQDVERL